MLYLVITTLSHLYQKNNYKMGFSEMLENLLLSNITSIVDVTEPHN